MSSSKLKRIALFLGVTMLALALIEVGMIVLEPWLPNKYIEYDRDLGSRVRPGARGSNQYGFNDQDYAAIAPPGVTRAMILSDSFNWAGGREGNCTSILRHSLQSKFGANRIEILNAGYPSTNTRDQLDLMEKLDYPYSPDIVVLGFFIGNDFFESYPHTKRVNLNGVYFKIERSKERFFLGYPMVGTSRLWGLVAQRATFLVTDIRRKLNKTSAGHTFSDRDFMAMEKERMESFMPAFSKDERCQYALEYVSRMAASMRERGIEFHVALYPAEFQVYDELFQKVLQAKGLGEGDADRDLPNKLLIAHLEKEGIPYFDLTPGFREAGKTRSLYKEQDTHWNLAGNQLAAELLHEYMAPLVARSRLVLD